MDRFGVDRSGSAARGRAGPGRAVMDSTLSLVGPAAGADGAWLSGLILRIAERGDRDAFAGLFAHFAPRVKSYMMRLGVESEAAEELAQETLLTVWRRAASFDPRRAAASTWIFTIARNLRIDLARRERRRTPAQSAWEDPPAPATPVQILEDVEDGDLVSAAVSALPQEQAQVIRLAFFADKPHSEIAGELGLPLGTVKSRLRLAMVRLRAALQDGAP
jgi:RNA polymerase sigma factor (sigma-70 family)